MNNAPLLVFILAVAYQILIPHRPSHIVFPNYPSLQPLRLRTPATASISATTIGLAVTCRTRRATIVTRLWITGHMWPTPKRIHTSWPQLAEKMIRKIVHRRSTRIGCRRHQHEPVRANVYHPNEFCIRPNGNQRGPQWTVRQIGALSQKLGMPLPRGSLECRRIPPVSSAHVVNHVVSRFLYRQRPRLQMIRPLIMPPLLTPRLVHDPINRIPKHQSSQTFVPLMSHSTGLQAHPVRRLHRIVCPTRPYWCRQQIHNLMPTSHRLLPIRKQSPCHSPRILSPQKPIQPHQSQPRSVSAQFLLAHEERQRIGRNSWQGRPRRIPFITSRTNSMHRQMDNFNLTSKGTIIECSLIIASYDRPCSPTLFDGTRPPHSPPQTYPSPPKRVTLSMFTPLAAVTSTTSPYPAHSSLPRQPWVLQTMGRCNTKGFLSAERVVRAKRFLGVPRFFHARRVLRTTRSFRASGFFDVFRLSGVCGLSRCEEVSRVSRVLGTKGSPGVKTFFDVVRFLIRKRVFDAKRFFGAMRFFRTKRVLSTTESFRTIGSLGGSRSFGACGPFRGKEVSGVFSVSEVCRRLRVVQIMDLLVPMG